ncbi:MAG TPA: sigma-70 family RNA polymerase sigma factor [Acidimicrobiia bacterium]
MTERTVTELLAAAGSGEQAAWDGLVERFGRLVWSVVRGFRLDAASAADVSQTVWLRLVENVSRIRDPERLASWLATTARNESIRAKRKLDRAVPTMFEFDVVDDTVAPLDERMIRDEGIARVAAAFNDLAPQCQDLLRLLVADPPLDYETIATIVERPIGSIGPTRARCLERLRRLLEVHELGVTGQDTDKDE